MIGIENNSDISAKLAQITSEIKDFNVSIVDQIRELNIMVTSQHLSIVRVSEEVSKQLLTCGQAITAPHKAILDALSNKKPAGSK